MWVELESWASNTRLIDSFILYNCLSAHLMRFIYSILSWLFLSLFSVHKTSSSIFWSDDFFVHKLHLIGFIMDFLYFSIYEWLLCWIIYVLIYFLSVLEVAHSLHFLKASVEEFTVIHMVLPSLMLMLCSLVF
jgi:hypothetical protein